MEVEVESLNKDKDKLALIVMDNILDFGMLVNERLKEIRNRPEYDYRVSVTLPRFSNGESKAVINDSVRGRDVFIITDVGNYSCTYKMLDFVNHKSPDDHFTDLKRVISATGGTANKIHVIMPLLYASRQHKQHGRESQDCALALKELENLGVDGIITFDVHADSIRCAILKPSFDNLFPTYGILKKFLNDEDLDFDNLMIVAPDSGAVDRARYYSQMLVCDVGMYYKRRDFSKVENGKNPVVAHEYLGKSVEGKTIIITDDMIASGGSILEAAQEMKTRGASKIYLIATFALFSNGSESIQAFDKAYEDGIFNKIYTTNLTYVPKEVKEKPWYAESSSAEYLARIINNIHEEESISKYLTCIPQKSKIASLVNEKKSKKEKSAN